MDRRKHKKVIEDFLKYLNDRSDDFILKGGTALMECYGLDRFSEDIDFDGRSNDISEIIFSYCEERDYLFRTAKDTDTVKRYMINYGENKPLKVETSFRKKLIPDEEITYINGICVYTIDAMAELKCGAYAGRDKIRDLYDLTFICNNYFNELSSSTKRLMRNVVAHKGIEQFDYIINNQVDELIDTDILAEQFLKMFDVLGLMITDEEKNAIENNQDSENMEFVNFDNIRDEDER